MEAALAAPVSAVSAESVDDLRLRPPRSTFFILRRIVSLDRLEESESEPEDELSSELDESSQAAAGPGIDSASTMCCGVDSYM